ASHATYSSDGKRIAYNPLPVAFNSWKHYRGGRTATIWVFQTSSSAVDAIPQPAGRSNDTDPMWIGDVVYFRSDRAGEFNLFSYDTKTKALKQLTHFDDFGVIDASMGNSKIIFERAGYLNTFDVATGQSQQLPVQVTSDLVETR